MRFYILPIRVCLILSCLAILPVHALGQGQEQGLDPDRFLEFLEQKPRAERGVNEFILGRSYLLGLFHEQDQEKGLELLQRAAQSGYIPAMLLLAEAFEKGLAGIERDYVQAQKWYSQAAEQGSEPAKLKVQDLGPADPAQDFRLFGIALNKADRFALRYALQRKEAEPLRLEDSSKCDVFASQDLLPGSDQLQACFTADGKLAHVEYRFPPRPPEEQELLHNILEDLRDKYGEPEEMIQEQGAPMLYRWQEKEVRIEFWQEGTSQTVFLRYSLPENKSRLNQELQQEQEKQEQEKKIDPQNY
ncbi:MAG: tetratricopeptide repeat protein [Desulfohalobiaceae bacterium]